MCKVTQKVGGKKKKRNKDWKLGEQQHLADRTLLGEGVVREGPGVGVWEVKGKEERERWTMGANETGKENTQV